MWSGAVAAALLAATVVGWWLLAQPTTRPAPPDCVASYDRLSPGDKESCLIQSGNWCEKVHPKMDEDDCLDQVFFVSSSTDGNHH
jgi:hypothetical protein